MHWEIYLYLKINNISGFYKLMSIVCQSQNHASSFVIVSLFETYLLFLKVLLVSRIRGDVINWSVNFRRLRFNCTRVS